IAQTAPPSTTAYDRYCISLPSYACLFRLPLEDNCLVRRCAVQHRRTERLLPQVTSQRHGVLQLPAVLQQVEFPHRHTLLLQARFDPAACMGGVIPHHHLNPPAPTHGPASGRRGHGPPPQRPPPLHPPPARPSPPP